MEFDPGGSLASSMRELVRTSGRAQIKYLELLEREEFDPLHLSQELRELVDRLDQVTECVTTAYAAAAIKYTEVRNSRGPAESLARKYEIEA
jgi:hypothetical protein